MKECVRKVFIKNCFLPLDTPVLELSEVLLAKSGGEIDKEVYRFTKGDTDICMRYDLTVPLARYVAMNCDTLTYPFRRYQIGKVYRGEKPQRGRFRELYQCDADIIGLEELSPVADAECVKLLCDIFEELGFETTLHISNRNILVGYVESLNITNTREVLTILDKLAKIGRENAIFSLNDLGVNNEISKNLIDLTTKSGDFSKILKEIKTLCNNPTFSKGIEELKELETNLNSLGLQKNKYVLDIGIIRGQDYYTGTVFEMFMNGHPEFGAVGGGGRYDNLAEYFTDKKMPGVGMSVGFTRLFDFLDNNNMLQTFSNPIKLAIIPLGDTLQCSLALASKFRQNDIATEVFYDNRSFKAKLKEAGRREIPFVIIVGEDEVKEGKYTLKNMFKSTQEKLSLENCIETIKK